MSLSGFNPPQETTCVQVLLHFSSIVPHVFYKLLVLLVVKGRIINI